MRNKLLHQFWAKALGVPLFIVCTVLSLLCVASFVFNASGSEYYLEHNFAGPFAGLFEFFLGPTGHAALGGSRLRYCCRRAVYFSDVRGGSAFG